MTHRRIEKKIQRLSERFWGGRPWYQCIDFASGISTEPYTKGKARQRTETFLRVIPEYVKPDDIVCDLGCNAGLFAIAAAQICQKAEGIEIDKGFYKQALFVRDLLASEGKRIDNVILRRCNILDNLTLLKDATVIFASKILYHKHIGDGVYNVMSAIESSPARLILAQGHVTQGTIGQNEGMKELFNRYNFSFNVIEDDPEYPIVVGERIVQSQR